MVKQILISNCIGSNNKRIWVPNEMLTEVRHFWCGQWLVKTDSLFCPQRLTLDKLSVWGARDKKDEEFSSWEFPAEIDANSLQYIIQKIFPGVEVIIK